MDAAVLSDIVALLAVFDGQREAGDVEVDGLAVEVARADEHKGRHEARHSGHGLAHAALEPAQEHADLGGYGEGEVVVEERADRAHVDAVEGAAGHRVVGHALEALGEGGVSPVAEQRPQVVSALLDGEQQALGAGRGLGRAQRLGKVTEVAGGDLLHVDAEVCQGLVLDLGHKVGDVLEVGVEGAAGHAGALGHGGDGHARKVAGGVDLLRERASQRGAGTDASAVGAYDAAGHPVLSSVFTQLG